MTKTPIFTLDLFSFEKDEYLDLPMPYSKSYYTEAEAVAEGKKLAEKYDEHHCVNINFGEWEDDRGNTWGDITHSMNVEDL